MAQCRDDSRNLSPSLEIEPRGTLHSFHAKTRGIAVGSHLPIQFFSGSLDSGQRQVTSTGRRRPYGFVCLPMQYDRKGLLFWYLDFVPLYIGIPIVYVMWVFFNIHYHQLLPASTSSRRRALTIFFFRITGVFNSFWTPTMVVYYMVRGIAPWGMFVVGLWSHLQGAVAALVTFMKPDVKQAVVDFVRCRWRVENATASRRTESIGASGYSFSFRQTSTDFTIPGRRLEDARRASGPLEDSQRSLPVENKESFDSSEASMHLDTVTIETEHEDIESNCLASAAREELFLEVEELDEHYWHVDDISGKEQCKNVPQDRLTIPKPSPSKLKEVVTDEKE